ncbi:putative gustatory receptor 28b [Topomyia yanbarensis]|uniref:putative gustatory receptor 28b n=1 Tax=Topomyia yanbarensis TaxID=2498891 RepID=UPI00273CC1EE|nr:putative gustatory receptor 28b [Topomyia yanbarensis]
MLFRNINWRVTNAIETLRKFDTNVSFWDRHRQEKLEICHELATKIDQLCCLHRAVDQTIQRTVRVFSLPMTIIILYQFLIVLSEAYYDYIFLITDLKAGRKHNYGVTFCSMLFILMCGLQFFYTVSVCAQLTRRAEATGLLLNELILSDVAKRVDLSIGVFSIEMLHHSYCIELFGLFPVDFTLLYSIVGTITHYLIILVQFGLEENHS